MSEKTLEVVRKAKLQVAPKNKIETIETEITLSPIHTCATGAISKGSGLAIRFPRFTGNYRLDKSAKDALQLRR